MKTIMYILLICSVLSSGWVGAASNADRQIENVVADISRYEKQFAGQASVSPNTIKRTLKLLGLTRQRLDSVADQSSPAWQQADTRYNTLLNQLKGMLASGGAQQSTPASTPSASGTVKKTTKKPTAAAPKQMIAQYQIRVKKLKRDVDSVFVTMDTQGVKPFQDPKYVQKYMKSLNQFKDAIKKYTEFSSHPTVVAANQSIAKLEGMITFGKEQAAKDLAVLGDVQSRLRAMHQTTKTLNVPAMPSVPFKKGELGQWLPELGAVRQAAIATYQPLPQIKEMAYLPNTRFTVQQTGIYEMSDVDMLEASLRGIVSSVDTSLKTFSDNLHLNIVAVAKSLSIYEGYDPEKDEGRLKHFLYEGRADEVKSSLASHHLLVSEAIAFSTSMKTKDLDGRVTLLKRVENVTKQYQANFVKALSLARMPKSVSTDSELLAIARKALQTSIQPGYDKVGEIKRIVITSKKVHRANDVSHETIDKVDINSSGDITMSGTAITYHFEWDEFKVVSAERDGDKHYIYYNSLTYYSEGGQKTKLHHWMVTGRLKGAEISVDNIDLE